MAHSKRNTSRAVFTSYERDSLKSHWGSQSARLSSNSFLPFGSCQLCLLRAVDPVACPSGDIFCRECAMTNLLAQRKEIKRIEKEMERQRQEEAEQQAREEEEARQRAVSDFESTQMGLNIRIGDKKPDETDRAEEERTPTAKSKGEESSKGTKRKFELDEDELKRIAQEERARAKRHIEAERLASQKHLSSFWVPTETPETNHKRIETVKRAPTCPASDPSKPHPLSLKGLTTVNFTEEKSPGTDKPVWTCPSCRKALSNATKGVLAIPCGHVLCKTCVDRFLKPDLRHHRDAHEAGPEPESVHCYVCDADLTSKPEKEGKKHKKDKERAPKPGLVDITCEGTGFAGGGKNMVKREGVAFQV